MLQVYQNIQTIKFSEKIYFNYINNGYEEFSNGEATLTYWASGDKYRIEFEADPSLKLWDRVVAFDGEKFQVFYKDGDGGTIHIYKGDWAADDIPATNLLFLPFTYLRPDSDTCAWCKVRFSWIRKMEWLPETRKLRVNGSGEIITNSFIREGVDGNFYNVSFNNIGLPGTIELSNSENETLEKFVIKQYEVVENIPFAKHAEYYAFSNEMDGPAIHISYHTSEIRINSTFSDSLFTINFDEANTVWDVESKSFLKHPKHE
jgi:hypothetical protein